MRYSCPGFLSAEKGNKAAFQFRLPVNATVKARFWKFDFNSPDIHSFMTIRFHDSPIGNQSHLIPVCNTDGVSGPGQVLAYGRCLPDLRGNGHSYHYRLRGDPLLENMQPFPLIELLPGK